VGGTNVTITADDAAALWAADTPTPNDISASPVDVGGVGGYRTTYRHYKPLEEAADAFASQARTLSTGQRLYTGIPIFDDAMRGIGPKELCIIVGFAHSGKTVFATQMILNNPEEPIALFTIDEDRVLVLVKLVSLLTGESAEDLERRIANGDEAAEKLVRGVAKEAFPRLAVFDEVASLDAMTRGLMEAEDAWGSKAKGVFVDYLDLLQIGEGDGDTRAKASAIKAWGKTQDVPLVVLHQTSRSGGAPGQEITLTSGAYGGEQQAYFMVGVRRKRDSIRDALRELNGKLKGTPRNRDEIMERIRDLEDEARIHQNTITFNLVKCKRPPSRLVEDVDFVMDHRNGQLTPFTPPRLSVPPIGVFPPTTEQMEML
jgi:hypothetical protein